MHRIKLDTPESRRLHFELTDLAVVETFHESSKTGRHTGESIVANVAAYLTDPQLIGRSLLKRHRGRVGTRLDLIADPSDASASLQATVASRRSPSREKMTGSISLKDIATVLQCIGGNLRVEHGAIGSATIQRRGYPSAGALYPAEVYVVSQGGDGLPGGVHLFDPDEGCLWSIRGDVDEVVRADMMHDPERPAPCILAVTGVLDRSVSKYGIKGYRLALLEAGHLSQNLVLAASAAGLKALPYASFFEREMESGLGLDGVSEVLLTTILLSR